MNRKWGYAALVLFAAAALYYFTAGKTKAIEEMHSEVHQQLSVMAQQGFKVASTRKAKDQEHIELLFDDPQKVAAFFQTQGILITPADTSMLHGLKIAVDLHYLPDTAHAVAADIYPVTLPRSLTENAKDDQEKKLIAQLQEMLKRKVILLHLNVSKTGSRFNGSMKDINETLQTQKAMQITMQGFTFDGDMGQGRLKEMRENLKQLSIQDSEGLKMTMEGVHTNYIMTGKTPYDYTLDYTIEKMAIAKKQKLKMQMHDIRVDSLSHNQNGLLYTEAKAVAKTLSITAQNRTVALENILLEIKADHLDIQALEILQNTPKTNQDTIDKALKQLLSKGVVFEIANFSIARIRKENQTLQGLTMHAKFKIDKGFDPAAARRSPLAVLDKISAQMDLALSNDLFAMLAGQPQAMMMLMLFPPQDLNGKKHYTIKLQKGTVTLNGRTIQ